MGKYIILIGGFLISLIASIMMFAFCISMTSFLIQEISIAIGILSGTLFFLAFPGKKLMKIILTMLGKVARYLVGLVIIIEDKKTI